MADLGKSQTAGGRNTVIESGTGRRLHALSARALVAGFVVAGALGSMPAKLDRQRKKHPRSRKWAPLLLLLIPVVAAAFIRSTRRSIFRREARQPGRRW